MGRLLKIGRGYLISIIVFVFLTGIFAMLLKFTSLPMENSNVYVLAALAFSAFLFGVFTGNAFKRRGLFLGILFGILYILTLIFLLTTMFNISFFSHLWNVLYLIPLIGGGVGGILGANLKN